MADPRLRKGTGNAGPGPRNTGGQRPGNRGGGGGGAGGGNSGSGGGGGTWRAWVGSKAGQTAKQTARQRGKGGNSSAPWKVRRDGRWQPVQDPGEKNRPADRHWIDFEPVTLRFRRQANGEPFFHYMAAWVKVKGQNHFCISNAHNGAREDYPCLLLYKLGMQGAADGQRSPYEAGEYYGVEVELLEGFHRIEQKNGEYVNIYWERCAGKNAQEQSLCEYCDEGDVPLFGRTVHWSMYPTQKKILERALEKISDTCATCREGTLSVYRYECPSCGACYGDHKLAAEDPNYNVSREDEELYREQEVTCGNCQTTAKAKLVYECLKQKGMGPNKRWVQGCGEGLMLDPWDCVITLKTEQNGRSPSFTVVDFAVYDPNSLPETTGFEFSKIPPLKTLFDTMPLTEQMRELGLEANEIPFDIAAAQKELDAAINATPAESDDDSTPWEG